MEGVKEAATEVLGQLGALLGLLLAQEWLWGAALGACLAFLGQIATHRRQQATVRKLASMQAATQLRVWIRRVGRIISDIQLHDSHEGQAGHLHTELPPLPFEGSIDQISQLDPKEAFELFELIHRREVLHDEFRFAIDMVDFEDAYPHFRRGAADLYLAALPIYSQLADRVGWDTPVFNMDEVEMVKKEIEPRSKSA